MPTQAWFKLNTETARKVEELIKQSKGRRTLGEILVLAEEMLKKELAEKGQMIDGEPSLACAMLEGIEKGQGRPTQKVRMLSDLSRIMLIASGAASVRSN